jgi:desulfoferrodoxin (superoxide reductase-like protein)
MEERHYIERTEVVVKDGVTRKFLKPNGAPEVAFEIEGGILQVRAYCSIHGLLTEKEV